MGLQQISESADHNEMRRFVKSLLEDVHALERMLADGKIETGTRRIGAEQEMFLVDRALQPTKLAQVLLAKLGNESYTTELGLFNLEANLKPQVLGGDCFGLMHTELSMLLERARVAAKEEQAQIVLCGILPTLEKAQLSLDYMTPSPRYLAMNRLLTQMRGGKFEFRIKGVDELSTSHDNVMLEACTTSFQIHYQVTADEFASRYNLAQVITAPCLAVAVNSPVLLQHRLWHETRIAIFQQSLDTRSEHMTERGQRQRVNFGEHWVDESILEIYREDVARFRSLIAIASDENPMKVLAEGGVPQLKALRLHNGTVYRWNRPCYGISDGKPHLRIENRVIPAGPSVIDEIANAAFFVGLMSAAEEFGDVTAAMSFDDARANFVAAARYGLHARLRWLKGRAWSADELVLKQLLPMARRGLEAEKVAKADIDRYLGVIEQRVTSDRTGAQWSLDSLSSMGERGRPIERYRALTAALIERQQSGEPVHEWSLASLEERDNARENYRTVRQVMNKDMFTVRPDDVADLAASLMEWQKIRYVLVEDEDGRLAGLVSHRAVLSMLARAKSEGGAVTHSVREIMRADVVTVTPDTSSQHALDLMRRNKIGCLPVVQDGRLVGVLTEHDFMELASVLLDRWLKDA
ncbi:MAG: CBS domain-containing protein [Planctomycetota bacterium]|nr:CBS domain-containing protein [Planctomycetota bacterium]